MNGTAVTYVQSTNGALISPPIRVGYWPVVGGVLEVPPQHQAVLTGPHGHVRVLGDGLQILRQMPWGWYTARMVDVRRRILHVRPVAALTEDGWQASVRASLEYQVCSAHAVVQLYDPLTTLEEAAVATMTAIIKMTPHDDLIGTGAAGGAGRYSALNALSQLHAALRGSGLKVISIRLDQVQGDERRLEISRRAAVEQAQLLADQTILVSRIRLERDQQALELLKTETKCKQAVEEQRLQIEQARIKAEVAKSLYWAREVEAHQQLIPELARQQHEKLIEMIKVYGQVLGQLATSSQLDTLSVSSRRRPEEVGFDWLQEVLGQGLDQLRELASLSATGTALEDTSLLEAVRAFDGPNTDDEA